jgi:probable rRNA maturation factor
MVQVNKINFHFLVPPFFFPKRKELKAFLLNLFQQQGKRVEAINYIFCSDEYLLDLNRAHLNHDTYTDIITFELSPKNASLLADIYISVERVKENAQTLDTGFQKEIHRVIFHGALHLCGYKDKTRGQAKKMRNMEELYLNKYFVPRGTGR